MSLILEELALQWISWNTIRFDVRFEFTDSSVASIKISFSSCYSFMGMFSKIKNMKVAWKNNDTVFEIIKTVWPKTTDNTGRSIILRPSTCTTFNWHIHYLISKSDQRVITPSTRLLFNKPSIKRTIQYN